MEPLSVSTLNLSALHSLMKPKTGQHPPTKVLYVRNLPESVTEAEFTGYCSPFGAVANILLLKDKRHGFVEFEERQHAVSCVTYFSQHPLVVAGIQVEFAFSGRSEITFRSANETNPPNRILLLTVTNLVYPVTVEVLAQIFSKYGGLEKAIVFNRGNVVQALVQLGDVSTAVICKNNLDGQNIYAGCNALRVQFSLMRELDVKQNSERTCDFTGKAAAAADPPQPEYHPQQQQSFYSSYSNSFVIPPILQVTGLNVLETTPEHLAALFAIYGNVVRVECAVDRAYVQLQDLNHCRAAQQYLNGIQLHGKLVKVEMQHGQRGEQQSQSVMREFANQPLLYSRHKADKVQKLYSPSISLHVSNMPDGTSEEELLTLLMTVGGEIRHIRFLDDQRHIAIAVCSSVENAIETLVRAHGMVIGLSSTAPRPIRLGFGHQPMDPAFYAQTSAWSAAQAAPGQVFITEDGSAVMIAEDGSAVPVILGEDGQPLELYGEQPQQSPVVTSS
jgi:RNA recognition motif-containing protein